VRGEHRRREIQHDHEQRRREQPPIDAPREPPGRIAHQQIDQRHVHQPIAHPPDAVQNWLRGHRQRRERPQPAGANHSPSEARIACPDQIRQAKTKQDTNPDHKHRHRGPPRRGGRTEDSGERHGNRRHTHHHRDRQRPDDWTRADPQPNRICHTSTLKHAAPSSRSELPAWHAHPPGGGDTRSARQAGSSRTGRRRDAGTARTRLPAGASDSAGSRNPNPDRHHRHRWTGG
jgi:hypothetical protein